MKSFSGYVWVLWLCIALLAIGNSAAALRIVALRRMASAGPPQLSPTGVETFLDMVSRGTAAPISWSPAGRYAVIFVFTPFDCPAALDELETLAELSRERHDIGGLSDHVGSFGGRGPADQPIVPFRFPDCRRY